MANQTEQTKAKPAEGRDWTADRAVCDAATSGPWVVIPDVCGPEGQGVYETEDYGCICKTGDPYPRGNNRPTENIRFIAEARTGWPAALDEIERLQAENQRYKQALESITGLAASMFYTTQDLASYAKRTAREALTHDGN